MKKLFQSSSINKLILQNRFIRSATWEGLATKEGGVTSELIEKMVQLAKGGVGLITSSHAYVSQEGQGTILQLGIYKDELISGYKKLTDAVHKNGGKIILQLSHAGLFANRECINQKPLSVSKENDISNIECEEISISGIKKLVCQYKEAASRAVRAGFDGIQLHSAHGYFLSQFLSPIFNKRNDLYGGSIENRTRIHIEILNAIREIVGNELPITIKINSSDFFENGLEIDESLEIVKIFSKAGFDAIELSGGIIGTGALSPSRPAINTEEKEAYFRKYAKIMKKEIGIPLILVGGVRSYDIADSIIKEDIADYISLSRPLICEPDLINRWKSGNREKSKCKSDNLCFKPGFNGEGVYCVVNKLKANKA